MKVEDEEEADEEEFDGMQTVQVSIIIITGAHSSGDEEFGTWTRSICLLF